jgi:hypothetical protein
MSEFTESLRGKIDTPEDWAGLTGFGWGFHPDTS